MTKRPRHLQAIALMLLLVHSPDLGATPQPGVPSQFGGFSCLPLIRDFLSAPATEEFEITPELAQGIRDLDQEFLDTDPVRALLQPQQAVCKAQASHAFEQLLQHVSQRFLHLIQKKHDLAHYYNELNAFLKPWDEYQRTALAQSKVFQEAHVEYSKLLYSELVQELESLPDPHWRDFLRVPVQFVGWTREWTQSVGRDEPAGFELSESERLIALQTHKYAPEEMKVFLFHEFAHLNDPNLRVPPPGQRLSLSDRSRNELYAWERTFEFIEARKLAGIPVPDHFRFQVLPLVQLLGFERWVKAIFSARGI